MIFKQFKIKKKSSAYKIILNSHLKTQK